VRNGYYLAPKAPTYSAGSILCAANTNYPIATAGEVFIVGEGGKVGGVDGLSVVMSDFIVAIADSPAGDHATVGSNWNLVMPEMDMSDLRVTDLFVADSATFGSQAEFTSGVVFSGDVQFAYLTTDGIVMTDSNNGTLWVDTASYLNLNQDNGQSVVNGVPTFTQGILITDPFGVSAVVVAAAGVSNDKDLTLRCGAISSQTIRFQHWNGSGWADVAHATSSGFVVDGQIHLSTGGLTVAGNTGWTGTFLNGESSTVTVTRGIITNVA